MTTNHKIPKKTGELIECTIYQELYLLEKVMFFPLRIKLESVLFELIICKIKSDIIYTTLIL